MKEILNTWSGALNANRYFRGIIVPAVTPYLEDRSVDYHGVGQIFDYFGNHPAVDGLFITGATGEYNLLELDERRRILDIAAKQNTGKLMVPNTSTGLLDGTLELTRYAVENGFHTVGTIIPQDCKAFPDVEAFFEKLAKLDVSVFIYQTGGSTYPLPVDELGRLLSIGNIVGIKDSCSPKAMTRHIDYIRAFSDRISVIQGVEMLFLCSAVMGGAGVIGGGCNVYPALLKRISDNLEKGDIVEARKYQNIVNEFIEVIYLEGSGNESMKYILSLSGVEVGCTSRKEGVVLGERKKQMLKELHTKLQGIEAI